MLDGKLYISSYIRDFIYIRVIISGKGMSYKIYHP